MRGVLLSAALLGILICIPICFMVYSATEGLESGVRKSNKFRKEFKDFTKLFGIGIDESSPELHYPVRRTITNNEGRALDVVITGRTREVVSIVSLRDNRNYQYPIESLSSSDAEFLRHLPIYDPKPRAFPVVKKLQTGSGSSIIVEITGRSQFELRYRNLESPRIKTIEINQLAPESRREAILLPIYE